MNRSRRTLLLAVLVAFSAVTSAGYYLRTRPELYKRCSSPDGLWQVEVFRVNGLLSVPLSVRAYRSDSGNIVFDETIDALDVWTDVEDRYPELICENEEVRLGPKFWDGDKFTYFRLRKRDL